MQGFKSTERFKTLNIEKLFELNEQQSKRKKQQHLLPNEECLNCVAIMQKKNRNFMAKYFCYCQQRCYSIANVCLLLGRYVNGLVYQSNSRINNTVYCFTVIANLILFSRIFFYFAFSTDIFALVANYLCHCFNHRPNRKGAF